MNIQGDTLQQYARNRVEELPGAGLELSFGPDCEAFKIREKDYMLISDTTDEPAVIVKAHPEDGNALREEHEDITQGYHMNKRHWITLQPGGDLQKALVDNLVSEPYRLVLGNLPHANGPVDAATFGRRDQ